METFFWGDGGCRLKGRGKGMPIQQRFLYVPFWHFLSGWFSELPSERWLWYGHVPWRVKKNSQPNVQIALGTPRNTTEITRCGEVLPITLPPIIMEVENDPIVEETSLVGTHSPLPPADHGRKSNFTDLTLPNCLYHPAGRVEEGPCDPDGVFRVRAQVRRFFFFFWGVEAWFSLLPKMSLKVLGICILVLFWFLLLLLLSLLSLLLLWREPVVPIRFWGWHEKTPVLSGWIDSYLWWIHRSWLNRKVLRLAGAWKGAKELPPTRFLAHFGIRPCLQRLLHDFNSPWQGN